MGKYRSKSGCLTCRQRRVKCDEVKPTCGNCGKKNRDCQWETPQTRFRDYIPESSTSSARAQPQLETEDMDVEEELDGEHVTRTPSLRHSGERVDLTGQIIATLSARPTEVSQQASHSQYLSRLSSPDSAQSSAAVAGPAAHSLALPKDHIPISLREARLVHHFAEYLGRWLDGTDPTRQFTLSVPEQVSRCPVLLHAVVCFAARHQRDDATAEHAYQTCLALVIERLNLNTALHDDDLLCAIVILRFFEQLNVPSSSGADQEQHLAGTSAILRSSQTTTVDPSAPTLREAAFWVYVRQCLYSATISQQPPNVNLSLRLHPMPFHIQDQHPLAKLRIETAWANEMTWKCARVANFCFDGKSFEEPAARMQQWQVLWNDIESWKANRPASFEPISIGRNNSSKFPEMYFTADWHVVAFGYYHFSCILLLTYKPGPKFATHFAGHKLSEADNQVLEHARAICGSCKSSPECITCLITLCHTIFIWGPLLSDQVERMEVLEILATLERSQRWPTEWIANALRLEWGLD